MNKTNIFLVLGFCLLIITSCSNDDDENTPAKTLVQSFNIALNTSNAIPMVSDRSETGIIAMSLFDDNSLEFTITVNNLATTDALTAAHIHMGDVVSAGGVAITLVDGNNIAFAGNTANGTITLSTAEISTLQGGDVYVNVHSTESGPGLVRGQIDQSVDSAYNVSLSPANAVPPIMGRSESGTAYFRLVGSTLYYKVIVNDFDATDAIAGGHIHEGSSSVNGGVFISLEIFDISQLNVTKSIQLDSGNLTKINNDELYVNIHSNQQELGLLRGQIR
jgi:CHRD domain